MEGTNNSTRLIMKKILILFFTIFCISVNAQKRNFFTDTETLQNTFIGAKGLALTNRTQLAAKLSINASHIQNFTIDSNNNISCYINTPYTINSSAFNNDSVMTYYIDLGGNCTRLNATSFHNVTEPAVHKFLIFPNVTSCGNIDVFSGGGNGTKNRMDFLCLPSLTPIGASGSTNGGNFDHLLLDGNVYVDSSNETIDGGSPDPDIADAITSDIQANVVYSSNKNAPGIVTGISTVTKDTVSIEIDWTALSHSNSIDYYVILVDGNFEANPSTGSYTITGLTTGTTYEIKILAIDEMGNSSLEFSEIYLETTD